MIIKLFLNVSKAEQKRRFLARLETPEKNWKFSPADIAERGFWDDYQEAFEDALSATSTEWAPWFILPADHKWVTRSPASEIIVKTIESLDLKFPKLDEQQMQALKDRRRKTQRGEGLTGLHASEKVAMAYACWTATANSIRA